MGTLYIVATPIGNLQDISLRSIEILSKVEIIACEDTRHTGLLLKHIKQLRHSGKYPDLSGDDSRISNYGDSGRAHSSLARLAASLAVRLGSTESRRESRREASAKRARMTKHPTLLSYYEQNEARRIPQILNALINGVDVALVSDAGTPTISDPGFKLVRECIAQRIRVESIPGPSSVISALVVSGLPTDKFLFLGYLPKKQGKRKKLLSELKSFNDTKQIHPTTIFFESPHRLIETLADTKDVLGNIDIVICRELTKIHEEILRSKVSESIVHFTKVVPKGEFVILFHQ